MTIATEKVLLGNQLLAILQQDDRQRLMPHTLVVELPADALLQDAGQNVSDTWFPTGDALAAFCVEASTGHAVEVALVGREGAVGGIVSNGDLPAFATARVRFPGQFLRIKTSALENAKLDSIYLRHWFSRYSDCLLAQVFQTAACNATHTIMQRAAKWLLAAIARTGKYEFQLTQDQFSEMLGVGRSFVSRVIGQMRNEGILETRRGVFIVRDETALRGLACDCTDIVEDHFDKVLHGVYPVA